jgi:hypothetical protein
MTNIDWVITVPHGMCENPTMRLFGYSNLHPCDSIAVKAATHIRDRLDNVVLFHQSTVKREVSDLNRVESSGNHWHDAWTSAVIHSHRNGRLPCVLDIHSYNIKTWFDKSGRSKLAVLDSPPKVVSKWTIQLVEMLGRDTAVWIQGSEVNYITTYAKVGLGIPAVLFEFWEGMDDTELTDVCLTLVNNLSIMSKSGKIKL